MHQIAGSNEYDVLIVGAGPAGLNAALVLGRMRRRVLVVDTDAPAHAVSRAVHGFLAQDGTRPSDLRRVGRQQLGPYTTVELRHVSACAARKLDDDDFALELADDGWVTGRRLLLAHGMHYGLPAVTGLAELWGTSVWSVAVATGSGARAAYAINASLISELPESSHDAQPPQTRTSEV